MNKDTRSRVPPPTPDTADELEQLAHTLLERARSMRRRLAPPSDADEIVRILDLVGYEIVE